MENFEITPTLREYVEKDILPRYKNFDKAHGVDHATTVIEQSLQLAAHYDVDKDMVYAIAAFHDTGLCEGRECHHAASARVVREDMFLNTFFTADEVGVIADAVEDHRASNKSAPRTIYGRIVAEADRLIDGETIVRRTLQYGLSHYPGMCREEHLARAVEHLREKYAEGGYLRLWIPESPNALRLRLFREVIADEERLSCLLERIFNEEAAKE